MKFNKWSLALAAVAVLAFASSVPAQTTPVASESAPASFFNSVQGYFTSFDTNSTTFQTERAEVWTGVDQSPDVLSAVFGLTYDVTKSWSAEIVFRNASVAGTVLSLQAGAGYRIVKYDTQITLGVDVGYRFAKIGNNDRVVFAEPFVDVRKALTENTYAGLRLYYQQDFSGNTSAHAPGVLIITGFKF